MILRRIEVSGWRTFAEKVSVGPFSEGLNLVFGPNGTGKSTLFEALRLAIFDAHGVRARGIEEIRPWGRELSPRVELEFSQGGNLYRLEKGFLEGAYSRILREEGGRFVPLMEGKAADGFVRELFSRSSPGRGLSKEEHLGLCQVLWAPQGGMELRSLGEDLVSSVREALGVQVSLAAGGGVEKAVERRYLAFFTRGGRLKTGKDAPGLVRLRKELEEVRGELEGARRDYEAYLEAVRKVEDLRLRREGAAGEAEALEKEVGKAREKMERYRDLENKRREAEAKARALEARFQEIEGALQRVKGAGKEVRETLEEIRKTEKELEAAGEEVSRREEAVGAVRSRMGRLPAGREEVEALGRRARKARDFLSARAALAELDEKIGKAKRLLDSLEEARKARASLAAPGRDVLARVEALLRRLAELQAQVRASSVRLEVLPQGPLDVKVLVGEDQERGDPGRGEPLEVLGAPLAEVEISGVGKVRASGPTGDLEELKGRIREGEEDLERWTRSFGTRDPEVLHSLQAKAEAKEREIALLEKQLEVLLGEEDLASLLEEKTLLEGGLQGLLAEFPAWREVPPDPERLQAEFERAREDWDREAEEVQRDLLEAEKSLAAARSKVESLEERAKDLKGFLAGIQARLEAEKPLDVLEREKKECALKWEAARAPLEELQEELAAFPGGDPRKEYEKLKERSQALREVEREVRDQEKTAEGRLGELARKGPYARLAALEERKAALEDRLAGEEIRAEAVKLLYETVGKFRADVTRRVARPVERAATRILERIAGPRPGEVVLDEGLAPASVLPVEGGGGVGLENLSGGEREQLHFACRLALAQVLAREERQLLVLDDVLTATDTARFARILGLLEEAAQNLQVVILSCHPERYAGLEGMARFDLEAVSQR